MKSVLIFTVIVYGGITLSNTSTGHMEQRSNGAPQTLSDNSFKQEVSKLRNQNYYTRYLKLRPRVSTSGAE